jgi:DUF4097 and DUF4098 domain-containing protein YvlB
LHVRRQGDVVQVPGEMKGIGLMYASLDLTVSVPGDLPVEITDSSGDISARRLEGDVEIEDRSGDIDVERVSGDVRIDRDSSGDIRIAEIGDNVEVLADGSGQVRVTSVKGTVRLP